AAATMRCRLRSASLRSPPPSASEEGGFEAMQSTVLVIWRTSSTCALGSRSKWRPPSSFRGDHDAYRRCHLATGGVGTIALQYAAWDGARAIGTARPAAETDSIRGLRATEAAHPTPDLPTRV